VSQRRDVTLQQPLLVRDVEAARLLGISRGSFRKLHDQGKVPAPIRLGRRVLWRVAELIAWLDVGRPPRDRWEWPGSINA
jgi:excisionase family DNA binding protein